MNEDRFSVLLLEKDVLEYVENKKKFKEYELKTRIWYRCCFRTKDANKKSGYYLKYIQSMRNLERKYRHVNVYTQYHKQLEQCPTIDETMEQATAPPTAWL